MNPTALGQRLDRWLSSTDRVVKAYSIDASPCTNAERDSALILLGKASNRVEAEVKRERKVLDNAKRKLWAKAWLEALLNNGIFNKLEALFLAVHELAKVAASTAVSQEVRYAMEPTPTSPRPGSFPASGWANPGLKPLQVNADVVHGLWTGSLKSCWISTAPPHVCKRVSPWPFMSFPVPGNICAALLHCLERGLWQSSKARPVPARNGSRSKLTRKCRKAETLLTNAPRAHGNPAGGPPATPLCTPLAPRSRFWATSPHGSASLRPMATACPATTWQPPPPRPWQPPAS